MAAAKTYAFLQAFLPAYLEDGQGVDLDLGLDDQSTEVRAVCGHAARCLLWRGGGEPAAAPACFGGRGTLLARGSPAYTR